MLLGSFIWPACNLFSLGSHHGHIIDSPPVEGLLILCTLVILCHGNSIHQLISSILCFCSFKVTQCVSQFIWNKGPLLVALQSCTVKSSEDTGSCFPLIFSPILFYFISLSYIYWVCKFTRMARYKGNLFVMNFCQYLWIFLRVTRVQIQRHFPFRFKNKSWQVFCLIQKNAF